MRPNTDTTRAGSKTAKNTDVPVTMEILPRSLLDRSKQNATTKDIKPGRYSYDVLLVSDAGIKSRVIGGSAIVTAGVTR